MTLLVKKYWLLSMNLSVLGVEGRSSAMKLRLCKHLKLASYLAISLSLTLTGCNGVLKGQPDRPDYENNLAKALTEKYSQQGAIPADQEGMTVDKRNQILSDLLFMIDVNYHKFEGSMYEGRAIFETTTDLAILGLGAAGAVTTHGATQAILAAVSAGLAGGRVSINKNFFLEKSNQALIAKMRAGRRQKLALIQKAFDLPLKKYPLARGVADVTEYYNAGTIVGALEDIAADAGADKKKADKDLEIIVLGKFATTDRELREQLLSWLKSNSEKHVSEMVNWLAKRSPPVSTPPPLWINDEKTTPDQLREAIEGLNIQ